MRNIKNLILELVTTTIMLSCLVACNGAGSNVQSTSNTSAFATIPLKTFMKNVKYTPLSDNSGKQSTFQSGGGNYFGYELAIPVTMSGFQLVLYDQPDCNGNILSGVNVPSSTYVAGNYVFLDGVNSGICSLFESSISNIANCVNEVTQTKSIRITFSYTAPINSSMSKCLSNPNNPITEQPGEFLYNYTSGSAVPCTTGSSCGFSRGYFLNITPLNNITESIAQFSGNNSTVVSSESFSVIATLNGPTGIDNQNISAVVVNKQTKTIESSIIISPGSCDLSSAPNPTPPCYFTVSTSNNTPAGDYQLQFTNQGDVNTESMVPFSVSAPGYFTITNYSNIESMVISPMASPAVYGNWSCFDGVNNNSSAFTLAPGAVAQCTVAPTNDKIVESFSVYGNQTGSIGSISYNCNATESGVCNESMSAFQFISNAPSGFILESSAQSVTFSSASCPTESQLNQILAENPGSVFFDNGSWYESSIPTTANPIASFNQVSIVNAGAATQVRCEYNTPLGPIATIWRNYGTMGVSSLFPAPFWSGDIRRQMTCNSNIQQCQFIFSQ